VSPQRRTTLLSLAPALPLLSRAAQISLPCPTLLPADLLSPRRCAPSPPLPSGAQLGKARVAVLGEARRGRAAARRARRGPRGSGCGGSRAPGMSLPLSPTLSLLSVLPHLSLSLSYARCCAARGRAHGGGSRRPRRLPATWIHTTADPGWMRGSRPAASTPCSRDVDPHGGGMDPWQDGPNLRRWRRSGEEETPAADPTRCGGSNIGLGRARRWAREWARRRVPSFFVFLND